MSGRFCVIALTVLAGVFNHGSAQFNQPPSVFTMLQTEREVYIGGIFQSIGGVRASNIAKWTADPPRFQAIGKGVPFVVEKMAFDARGSLLAAGFDPTDQRRRMAQWDGHQWDTLPLPGALRAILGLTVDPWGYVCILSSLRDSVEKPVLWRSNGGEWACLSILTQSANLVQSVVQIGTAITFAQGGAIWHFDGKRFTMIDGPNPKTGSGQGRIGHTFSRGYLFRMDDTLYAVGASVLQYWVNERWNEVSSLPSMGGSLVQIEAVATSNRQLIVSRSYFHHEIDIGWHVRRLYRWSHGEWSFSTFPYYCTSMAIVGDYLLTGHVSDEVQPMISVRKISEIPWVETK